MVFSFPKASLVAQLVKNLPALQETPGSIPGSGRSPGEGIDRLLTPVFLGFTGGSDGKESTCNVGDLGLILGLGRSPGGGHGNPLQYSCLENRHGQNPPSARVTESQRWSVVRLGFLVGSGQH